MKNIEIIDDLIKQLEDLKKHPSTDLGDIGNIIGITIGQHIIDIRINFCQEMGFDKEAFMDGLHHGFSLTDGTH
jgi:hypothetical protein